MWVCVCKDVCVCVWGGFYILKHIVMEIIVIMVCYI